MHDLVIPNIQNSLFAHVVHVLLIGGVAVYGWQAVKALVRKPLSVARAVRKAVNGAWLVALLLVLLRPGSIPSLRFAALMAAVMIAMSVFDKVTSPEERDGDERLTSGPAGVVGQSAARASSGARVQRN